MFDFFFVIEWTEIASYADDTTLYVCLKDIDLIIEKLEVTANEMLQWFNKNEMEVNADKYDPLTTTNEERDISVGGEKIQSSKSEKLLGVIDN